MKIEYTKSVQFALLRKLERSNCFRLPESKVVYMVVHVKDHLEPDMIQVLDIAQGVVELLDPVRDVVPVTIDKIIVTEPDDERS